MSRQHSGIFTRDMTDYLAATPEPAAEELAAGLWTVAAGDYRTIFLAGDDGAVAFNTFGSPATARAYRALLADSAGPIDHVVLTIDHLDHAGYGEEFDPEADVWAHELAARVMSGRAAGGQSTEFAREIGGEQEHAGGGRLLYPAPTVGSGNLAVHLPEQGALFVVGPRADARYGLFPDFHFRHYTSAMRSLLDLDFELVIPGRGPMMDRAQLERSLDYIDAISEASQRAFAEGVPFWIYPVFEPIIREALADSFGDLDGFGEHVGIGAVRIVHHFLMGGWGLEDTASHERLLQSESA